ncbi:MAG: bifunctional folylpolyglutamate synthase/dihydrofolate synthase [Candidatus Omnitrophica bacterium]|nr:bifunctional folylpolyglutamate synthase/dihydrofolate synthase [Candidatus Omnitrophota bacterium]MBU1133634.1 bifunctional folylpolyglutamate synthase/dihydrofolate synthase [Candidatus Omnitrophota bacterium]MBU1811332.1 bifunctional folylpolyglutamate synthase/dihydrofolate synthase [Candidatus Omnitrophota bacterium]
MKNYKEAKEYLDSFINYERCPNFAYKKSLKLERVKSLLRSLKIHYQKLKVIHIAGTKGKGSTAHFCAHLLAASGFKVGLYTSPHFFDFRERIRIMQNAKCKMQNDLISKKDVVKIVGEIRPYLEDFRITKELDKLTFFEVYTAIAFRYFIEKEVDFVVLETGLGGRLDATNVVMPIASIITHIGYDHTDKLGKRLVQIAYEKAGIIKRAVPVVSSSQRVSVLEVIRKKCKKQRAQMFLFGRDFKAESVKIRKNHTNFDFNFGNLELGHLKIFLKGKSQVENASCALAAISLLRERGLIKRKINVKEGLRNTKLCGRFEVVMKNPLVIMDIAHNPSSFSVLKENLKLYFPRKKVILIFAASEDKNVKGMLKEINFSHLVITRFHNPRSQEPLMIKEKCKLNDAFIAKDIKEAFKLAEMLCKRNFLILIAGSFFLVSEAKKILQPYAKL